jgi:hypothetical protein
MVGNFVVNVYMIKLPDRNLFVEDPGLASVARDADTTIITFYDQIRIFGMDPPGMVIGVNARVGNQGVNDLPPSSLSVMVECTS